MHKDSFRTNWYFRFQKRIMGLNVDGVSFNTGVHNGVWVLMQADPPWLQVIHCFNHCPELTIKDTFNPFPSKLYPLSTMYIYAFISHFHFQCLDPLYERNLSKSM